jgi:hypothetical protein
LGSTGLKAGFACLQTTNIPGQTMKRRKVKIYFAPGCLSEKGRQSLPFSEGKATKTPHGWGGFSLGLTGLKAGFACLQTANIPGQK